MEKNKWYGAAIIVAIAVVLLGAGYTAWFGSEGEPTLSEPQTLGSADPQQTMPQSDEIILSGMVNEASQLVNDEGDTFELANTDEGLEVKSLIGKKVEITGTVMEDAGQQIVEVHDYKILIE